MISVSGKSFGPLSAFDLLKRTNPTCAVDSRLIAAPVLNWLSFKLASMPPEGGVTVLGKGSTISAPRTWRSAMQNPHPCCPTMSPGGYFFEAVSQSRVDRQPALESPGSTQWLNPRPHCSSTEHNLWDWVCLRSPFDKFSEKHNKLAWVLWKKPFF